MSSGISLAIEVDDLSKKYGEYFYDYSIIMPTPFAFPNNDVALEEQLSENSSKGIYSSVSKIMPSYNYYDKNFEDVGSSNNENQLFNFYVPYYMILIADKVQDFKCVIKMYEIVFIKKLQFWQQTTIAIYLKNFWGISEVKLMFLSFMMLTL